MNTNIKHLPQNWGESQTMTSFELDRLFGMALTDARFFQRLRDEPRQAVAQFALTDSEAVAVMHIAPTSRSIEDLATELDSWMTQRELEPAPTCIEAQFIGLNSAARKFSISNDDLLRMVQEGRIRLSQHDVSQVAVQAMSKEYA